MTSAQLQDDVGAAQAVKVVDTLVIGAGIIGLTVAACLRRAGLDFCVLEAAGEVGGTWRDHNYPGCGADTEASTYVPSFAPLFSRHRFASRDELFHYCREFADSKVGLANIHFGCAVEKAEFDSARSIWQVTTSSGVYIARFVSFANFSGGSVKKIKRPQFADEEQFQGQVVHSSELSNDLEFFRDKKVVVVGCGATAVQLVPSIAPVVSRLTVLRRTLPYIKRYRLGRGPRSKLGYRLQGARLRLRNELISQFDGFPQFEFLYRWPYRFFEFGIKALARPRPVKPPFRQPVQCTRRAFDYLGFHQAISRSDVELVDISQTGVDGYTADGVRIAGAHYPADLVVLATGYHMGDIDFAIEVDGRTFDTTDPGNMQVMYGFVAGLPNAQVPVLGSPLFIIPPRVAETNVQYLIRLIQQTKSSGQTYFSILPDFAAKMTGRVRKANRSHIVLSEHCPSSRYLLSQEAQGERFSERAAENLPFVPYPMWVVSLMSRLLFSAKQFDLR